MWIDIRSSKADRSTLGKIVDFVTQDDTVPQVSLVVDCLSELLLCNALNSYNIDMCRNPAKTCFKNYIVSECVGRLLVQSYLTGLECNAIFLEPNE